MPDHERMTNSLEGLSIGDAFGQLHFRAEYWIRNHPPSSPWHWTDDTEMACVLVDVLQDCGQVDQDVLAKAFAKRFDRDRGYGPAMVFDLLPRLAKGEHWSVAAPSLFEGSGSFGNGAAMRVAPLGAFFRNDLDQVIAEAEKSAIVTHAHPEAVFGAIAVAVAAALFANGTPIQGPHDFMSRILLHLPDSELHRVIGDAVQTIPSTASPSDVAHYVGNGSRITAVDTVPFCLWMAGRHKDSFDATILETVSVGGDMDTTAAIVGGIIASGMKPADLPVDWLAAREPLPEWFGST